MKRSHNLKTYNCRNDDTDEEDRIWEAAYKNSEYFRKYGKKRKRQNASRLSNKQRKTEN